MPWKGPKAVQFTLQINTLEPAQSSAAMSSGTPFKSAKGLFLQEEGSNPGPFPDAGANRQLAASNFLYGTNKIPVFSPDGMQFSGFSYPSNTNFTPSSLPVQPMTSTPWNPSTGPAQSFHSMLSHRQNVEFTLPFHDLPGPPAPLKRLRVPKARITTPGASAVGVSVLSMKGWLATSRNAEIDLRLHSCTDITLISEELYLSLKDRPPLHATRISNANIPTDRNRYFHQRFYSCPSLYGSHGWDNP